MAYRPYPNRDRSRRQVERGRALSEPTATPAFPDVFAILDSDEHRQKMRDLGTRLADLFQRVTAHSRY